jgi:predicted lysophospholipase L1 biosynthesis ABC-type transport system permease subunit
MKDRPARRPTPEPLETNEVAIAVGGTIAWAVGLVVLAVFFRTDLQRHHATWWLWACGLGVGLGLYGLRFALRRRAHAAGRS